jgi:hypothetical protein
VKPELGQPIAGAQRREPFRDGEVERRPGAGRLREPALAVVRFALTAPEPLPQLPPRVRPELERRRRETGAVLGGRLAGHRDLDDRGIHDPMDDTRV